MQNTLRETDLIAQREIFKKGKKRTGRKSRGETPSEFRLEDKLLLYLEMQG